MKGFYDLDSTSAMQLSPPDRRVRDRATSLARLMSSGNIQTGGLEAAFSAVHRREMAGLRLHKRRRKKTDEGSGHPELGRCASIVGFCRRWRGSLWWTRRGSWKWIPSSPFLGLHPRLGPGNHRPRHHPHHLCLLR